MGDQEEPVVTYSLREILADMNRKLDLISTLIHGKADNSRVDQLDDRLRLVEKAQEHHQQTTLERTRYREWVIPVLLSAVVVVITVFQFFHH